MSHHQFFRSCGLASAAAHACIDIECRFLPICLRLRCPTIAEDGPSTSTSVARSASHQTDVSDRAFASSSLRSCQTQPPSLLSEMPCPTIAEDGPSTTASVAESALDHVDVPDRAFASPSVRSFRMQPPSLLSDVPYVERLVQQEQQPHVLRRQHSSHPSYTLPPSYPSTSMHGQQQHSHGQSQHPPAHHSERYGAQFVLRVVPSFVCATCVVELLRR